MLTVEDNAPQDTSSSAAGPPVAVYLRGAGAGKSAWSTITAVVTDQGWIPTRARTQAWHPAPGNLRIMMVDFSDVDLDTSGPVSVTVGRVTAKYDVQQTMTTVDRLLIAVDRQRLAGAGWLNTPVAIETRETVLPSRGDRLSVPLRDADIPDVHTARLVQTVRALTG